jgi:hypothetical protein
MKFNSIAQSSLVVLSALLAPIHSFAAEAPYCIAVNGGFGTSGGLGVDYIQLTREAATDPFTGQDSGYFTGSAEPVTCTSDLLTLPSSHD